MKKLNLSLAAIFAMGAFAVAGGDIAPVEPVVEEPIIESTGNFYLGLAYGAANIDVDTTTTYVTPGATPVYASNDWDYGTIMIQAGYNFNQYIAVEGRYWFGMDEDFGTGTDYNLDTWGIYVKPQYPVTDTFNVYALLGYANTDQDNAFSDTTLDGFSWGLGASYAFTDNLSVFIDYVDMYDDNYDVTRIGATENYDMTVSTWNFGVTYNF